MAGIRTVRLRFSGPVHFGNGRLSDGGYACDAGTLFSALFLEALRCDAAEGLLRAAQSGDLSLSDTFPYIGSELYLPKPMATREIPESADRTKDTLAKKATKKLPYIRSAKYRDFLKADMDALDELERFKRGLGASYLQTKVNLTREHKPDAEPYHVGGYRYNPNAGIYFLVRGGYDLTPLLDQLQYSGIGGERSSGYGRFEYEITDENPLEVVQPKPTPEPLNSSRRDNNGKRQHGNHGKNRKRAAAAAAPHQNTSHVLLSTAAPSEDELSGYLMEGARYRVVRRGGFVLSTTHSPNAQKKRDLYLFASGSMFPRTFEGDVFDVNETPGAHPVYRYARALWMEV